MKIATSIDTVPPTFLWLDDSEQQDEDDEAERQDAEARERGEEVPDGDLEKQRRLNKH